jgi:CBS domain-containing protein
MIGRVLRLADRPVRAITPRVELVWLDVENDPAEIARVIKESGHSRFVVGKGSLDEVLGVVHVRSLLDAYLAGRTLDLGAAVRPSLVLHDSMPVLSALEAIRQARVSMALVVDEYGEVEGVVTVEDVLEAVVGDMPERRLGEEPAIVRREDGSMLMDGLLAIDELKLAPRLRELDGQWDLSHARWLHSGAARPRARGGADGRLWRVAFRGRRHGRAAHRQGARAPVRRARRNGARQDRLRHERSAGNPADDVVLLGSPGRRNLA